MNQAFRMKLKPGTVDEYPNWRQPLPATLEEIVRDPAVRGIADILTAGRPRRPDSR